MCLLFTTVHVLSPNIYFLLLLQEIAVALFCKNIYNKIQK